MRFITRERQALFARHDLSLHPDKHDLAVYLFASERRYLRLAQLCNRNARFERRNARALEVGGFLGAYPLTLARLGIPATLVEQYGYYYGALDDLASFLTSEGVTIWDADFTEPLAAAPQERFTLVTNMAMLEHLASSPRILMRNIRACVADNGLLIVEMPNVAYWPNRLEALRGDSIHQPFDLVYASVPPYLGHHREYTVSEVGDLLKWTGFAPSEVSLFNYSLSLRRGTWFERLYTFAVYLWPTILFPACREIIMAAAAPSGGGDEPPAMGLLASPAGRPAGP